MSYVMKEHLANKANYGSKRDLSKIKYLVIHYTSNDGDSEKQMENILLTTIVKLLPITLLMMISYTFSSR